MVAVYLRSNVLDILFYYDICSIPAVSAGPKRVISRVKGTISDSRGSFKSETLKLLECLKSWFRLAIFAMEDLVGSTRNDWQIADSSYI